MHAENQPVIRSRFADDPEMCELVELFVEDIPAKIARLQTAMEQEDLEAVRTFAHQLKGAAGGYGFESLTPVAQRLEGTAAAATEISAARPHADEVVAYLEAIRM